MRLRAENRMRMSAACVVLVVTSVLTLSDAMKVAIGKDYLSNLLVVTINGKKGAVCSTGATDAVAQVVCRELGLDATEPRIERSYRWLPSVMDEVHCTGNETTLAECTYDAVDPVCSISDHLTIYCAPKVTKPRLPRDPENITVEIEGGGRTGKLIVTLDGIHRGTASAIQNSHEIAGVVCGELGWKANRARMTSPTESTDVPNVLHVSKCTGEESKLFDCSFSVGQNYREPMMIECSYVSVAIEGGGNKGRLLVTLNNKTGDVCRDSATNELAAAVCLQLGWKTTWAHARPATSPTTLPIVVDSVVCGYPHTSGLADCEFESHTCTESQGIEINCPSAPPDLTAAIQGGGPKGRLLVTLSNQTGPVCYNGDNKNLSEIAAVVCRELGWNTTMPILRRRYDRSPPIIREVSCSGSERRLAQCNFTTPGTCYFHAEINCSPAPSNVTVTIEGGGSRGRLIAIVDGQTGTVCDVRTNDALYGIVCREMGWNTTWTRLTKPTTNTKLPVALRNVHCSGDESKFFDCSYIADDNCFHRDDVVIDCSPELKITAVAIKQGGRKGRLVIAGDGFEGTVCNTGVTDALAVVACRQLGISTPLARIKRVFGETKLPTLIDNVVCIGNESSLNECTFTTANSCNHSQDVAIDCSAAPVTVKVELEGGRSRGRLLATVDGKKGTVCNDGATNAIAKVVCRQLGYSSSWPQIYSPSFWEDGIQPAMDEVHCTGNETSLAECSFITVHNCANTEDIAVDCSDVNGPVSDVMLTVDEYGYLFVKFSTSKGHVRLHGATNTTAVSICRDLGISTNAAAISLGFSTHCSIYNVYCTGKESSLTQCTFVPADDCLDSMVTKIRCKPADPLVPHVPLKVKVKMEGNGPMGRLFATVNGNTGLIRLSTPSNAVAAAVCRELGWKTTMAHVRKFVRGLKKYVLSDVFCTGNERKLADCTYSSKTDYSRTYDLGIDCSPDLRVTVGMVDNKRKGRLIAKVNGVSGYVCRTGATDAVAAVVCRELGWNVTSYGLTNLQTNKYDFPWLPIVMHEVYCTGHESTLANCTFTIFNECQDGALDIFCGPGPKFKGANRSRKVRSVATVKRRRRRRRRAVSSGTKTPPTITNFKRYQDLYRGRILAYVNGRVGSICHKGATPQAVALVVCRELGDYTPRARLIEMTKYSEWPVRAEVLSCAGNESRLSECSFTKRHNCTKENDIGVLCYPVPTFSIEGGGPRGRLIATNNLVRGTVCDSIANDDLASVICRELGYNTDRAQISQLSVKSELPVMLDDARCTGKEDKVTDCPHNPPDLHCYSSNSRYIRNPRYTYGSQDLEIDCSPVPAKVTNVTIEGGGRKGRLLVTVDGKTGTVCNDRATHALAAVACREMGLDTPIARITTAWTPTTLPVVMNEVRCLGNESRLVDCPFVTLNDCNHIEDVGVDCSPVPTVKGVRIEGGRRKGRLIVTVNGKTGSVCDDLATHALAEVVCRELGLDTNNPRITRTRTSTSLPIVMDEVQCTGNETRLADCTFLTTHNCDHSEDITVRCPRIKG